MGKWSIDHFPMVAWILRNWALVAPPPADTGRPGYHPATLLKPYLYGYLNRVPSSRRLEREAQHNLKVLLLTGRLTAKRPCSQRRTG